jgi:hypothetical protein
VAAKITEYLKATDRYAKTIVFCEDIDHAARMRQALANANADICATQPKYVVQITGDNPEGKRELDNFIDPEKTLPGDRHHLQAHEHRGGRADLQAHRAGPEHQVDDAVQADHRPGHPLREDLGKSWFTILDFKRATELFADPAFDGDPVQIYERAPDDPIEPPSPDPTRSAQGKAGRVEYCPNRPLPGPGPLGRRWPRRAQEVHRRRHGHRVRGPRARAIPQRRRQAGHREPARLHPHQPQAPVRLARQVPASLEHADRKAALIEELERQGVLLEALADEVGKDLDPFDLLLHVAYDQPPLTRRERAQRVKKRNVFTQYGPVARQVLDALLDKYADEGITTIESDAVLPAALHQLGCPVELIRSFGGRPNTWALQRWSASSTPPAALNTEFPETRTLHVQPLPRHQVHPGRHAPGLWRGRRRPAHQQLTWLLFLKVFDALEEELELTRDDYKSPIPEQHALAPLGRRPRRHHRRRPAGLRQHRAVRHPQNLPADPVRNPRGYVVRGVFEDAYNYMKSGQLLRQVINKLNAIDFNRQSERHQFNDLYEKILRDLQSAGNAGEFYTPRAVTQFMVDMVNPQLGEWCWTRPPAPAASWSAPSNTCASRSRTPSRKPAAKPASAAWKRSSCRTCCASPT